MEKVASTAGDIEVDKEKSSGHNLKRRIFFEEVQEQIKPPILFSVLRFAVLFLFSSPFFHRRLETTLKQRPPESRDLYNRFEKKIKKIFFVLLIIQLIQNGINKYTLQRII